MTTAHDEFVIDDKKRDLLQKYNDFKNAEPNIEELHREFDVKKKKGWNILDGWKNLQNESSLDKFIQPLSYRPFDNKYIFYEDRLVWRTVRKVMQHFINGENVGLVIGRQGQVVGSMQWNLSFITKYITDFNFYYRGGGVSFPLYIYPENGTLLGKQDRKPNLNTEIVEQIAKGLNISFTPEKMIEKGTFAPIDILDYIYAVLYSPAYRDKYKEFLKTDFPRVPYPKDKEKFWQLVKLGGELRQLHLLESSTVEKYVTKYPIAGSNEVIKPKYIPRPKNGETEALQGDVFINDEQYFKNVPLIAWGFYIGGYQPAQKWLKDRQGHLLSYDDITHYQKIIVALTETARLMQEIDKVGVE